MIARPKILAVVGPTSSGKTELAYRLARKFNGELVSADSRQVYKYLDIGTGKEGLLRDNTTRGRIGEKLSLETYPILRYIDRIPQWLTDIVDPKSIFTVAQYQLRAYKIIKDILSRDKLPIIVGGTGLYVSALLEGYQFQAKAPRSSVNVRHATGSQQKNAPNWDVLIIGIEQPRATLYQRINSRLKSRIENGLIIETRNLLDRGVKPERLRSFGLEYKYTLDYINGEYTMTEYISKLSGAIHAFARRQLTWWRHHGQVEWVSSPIEAMRLVTKFLTASS